jgi:hypothetical protein
MTQYDKLTLLQIKENPDYISIINNNITDIIKLNKYCSLKNLITKVHEICPELKEFCKINKSNFVIKSIKDKGLIGKIVEYYLFGNLPNSSSSPDMIYGDIKTTTFKNLKTHSSNAFNAKERLTLTNIGNPHNNKNIARDFENINKLEESRYYNKINKAIILIFMHDTTVYKTIEDYYNKNIIGIVYYNLNEIFNKYDEIKTICHDDFQKIKKCILTNNISQKGQQYIHLHKHGSKNSETRAFGFTNKFLTHLASIYLNKSLVIKGNQMFIEIA